MQLIHRIYQKTVVGEGSCGWRLITLYFAGLLHVFAADWMDGLPKTEWDKNVATPPDVVGFAPGEWHVRPEQQNDYLRALAQSSPRVRLETLGYSHENRPLQQLVISHPDNIKRLDELRQQRANGRDDLLVVWLCYSVHGNEASGSNASLITAYYLAAAKDPALQKMLENTLIILQPSLNPDGMARFASWVNSYRGMVPVADTIHTEHREAWPSGRGNHYWFDLNRDWLLLQQPESVARVKTFQQWRPNVLADFHEMGTDNTFFFQPGVPSRQHPSTPADNLKLTDIIARYHAQSFDEKQTLYYSKEGFDDFYYGKGSTYPDIQGGVGILFEQASARGHLQNSKNGPVSFPFAIRNQVMATLSTLKGAHEQRQTLMDYHKQFFQDALSEAANDAFRAIVIAEPNDQNRLNALLDVLLSHDIAVHRFNGDWRKDGKSYQNGKAYVVPLQQRQYRLIKNLFESRTQFRDPIFYDISTWNIAHAFDVSFSEIDKSAWQEQWRGERLVKTEAVIGSVQGMGAVAYVMPWDNYFAPRALYSLLQQGIKARVATKPFKWKTEQGSRDFTRGSIVIPQALQTSDAGSLRKIVDELAKRDGVTFFGIKSGYAEGGIDLGSPSLKALSLPKILLLIGGGVESLGAGETWFALDARMRIPVTMAQTGNFNDINLNDYTHLLMADGRYTIKDEALKKLENWIKSGGHLIAQEGAAKWLSQQDLIKSKFASAADNDNKRIPYAQMEEKEAEKRIAGAIFATNADITHPLAYGLTREWLPVFRTHNDVLPLLKSPYANVIAYTEKPLISGFASKENQQRIAGSAAVIAEKLGDGTITLSTPNLLFRGVWYGTSRVFYNSLFFSGAIDKPGENAAHNH